MRDRLREVRALLEQGFRIADVKSGPEGVTLTLASGSRSEVLDLDREDARRILLGNPPD